MKLTVFILLSACLTASAKGYTQTVTLSEKNAPLEKVFKEIKKQTGYNFLYTLELLAQAGKVNVEVKDAILKQALDECLQNTGLAYTIIEKTVVIKKSATISPDSGLPTPDLLPPPIDVKGRIVNENGEAVAGASVQVKGDKSKGTSTDENGYFELKGVDDNAVLVISGVNIQEREIKVSGKTDLATVTVKIQVTEGEEVLINTGYQKVNPNEVTGSFEKVDNKLFNRSVTTTVLERLEGIVPGLIFNKRIGSDNLTDISIRGISTLNSDQRPLIIIDNFPYEGDINNINPNDVENITVLKDAAAASIWGTRAGNGVIVITTKKGNYNQKIKVSLNTNVTVGDKPDLFYVPQFPSSEFIKVEEFLFSKGFYDADLNNNTYWPVVSPVVEILARRRSGLITASDSAAQISALSRYDIRNDYLKYLYQKSTDQMHSVNLSGGSNNINYLFSVGYTRSLANLVGNKNDRINISSQFGLKPSKNLELQIGTIYTTGTASNNSIGGNISPNSGGRNILYPYARLADEAGNHLAIERQFRLGYVDTAGNGKLLDWKFRPLDELGFADNSFKSQDILFNIGAKYNFTNWMNSEVKYQFEKQVGENRIYNSIQTYYTRDLINLFTPLGLSAAVNSAIPYGGILYLGNNELVSHSVRGQLNVNKLFRNKHNLSAIAGGEIRQTHSLFHSNLIYGYDDDFLTYRNVDFVGFHRTYFGYDATIFPGLNFSDITNRFVSLYGNAAYTFDKRYTISLSGRRDASNLFGVETNNKWKPLWSVGGKWDISREKFYNFSVIPELKLRMTYGFSGNVNNRNPAVLTLTSWIPSSFNNLPVFRVANPPNPTLRWENIGMFNIGLEFASKANRVRGSIEFYKRKSTDLIAGIPADVTTGFSSIRVNSATLKGKGLDIRLATNNINGIRFKWQSDLFFSYNTHKVAKYLFKTSSISTYASSGFNITPLEGYHAYSIFSWKWNGLDANGNPQGILNGQTSTDYRGIFNSSTFDDLVFHGTARPLYFGSLRNTFSFGQLSVSANVSYRFKYYFRRTNILSYTSLYNSWIQDGYSDYVRRWQKPGDEAFTNVPSMIYPANNDRDNFYRSAEINVERGDHIRFEDISVNYSLTKTVWKKMPINQITFYAYLKNLGMIWKASNAGLDPDYGTPPPKRISLGLTANF